MKVDEKSGFYLFADTAFGVTRIGDGRESSSFFETVSYRQLPLEILVENDSLYHLVYVVWQMKIYENRIIHAPASLLQPVAASCEGRGNKWHNQYGSNRIKHIRISCGSARCPRYWRELLSMSMATISNGRGLNLRIAANVKSTSSGVCLYYFATWYAAKQ